MSTDNMYSFYDDNTCSFVQPSYKLHCDVYTHYHPSSPYHKVALVGNVPALGCWDLEKAIIAKNDGNGKWDLCFDIEQGMTIHFKWVILDGDGQVYRWEEGDNKIIHVPRMMAGSFQVESSWCKEARIINVVDRYGRNCCIDEAIRFANVELAALMDENAERMRELEQIKEFDTKVSDSSTAMDKHRARYSWQRKMALAIGSLSGVAIGSTAIYMASFTEPEPEPTLAELTFGYIQDIAISVYEATTNMIFDAPEPEPTTTEQIVAAVGSVCDTMMNGINSLLGGFL
ncbi:hypothetical protein ACF0H5_019017 [Mactra antiquata]